MKTALFTNFTDEEFVGSWDGKLRKFPPGSSLYMPDSLAQHYAKHLVNRELLRVGADGKLIYKDGEKMTSPKFPEQVPLFMELFNKAYRSESVEMGEDSKKDALDVEIEALNKNRQKNAASNEAAQNPNEPQIVNPPEDDDEDESAFKSQ